MGTMEIALLVIGVIIFVISFLLPDRRGQNEKAVPDSQEIRRAMETELNGMKLRVNEATNETVDYAMERVERQLERVSNEKIMALSEYADTIMQGIDKSHQELLFLYDMLSDKQTDLKNVVREAEATVREVETAANAQTAAPEQLSAQPLYQQPHQEPSVPAGREGSGDSEQAAFRALPFPALHEEADAQGPEEMQGGNNNERILALSRDGRSTVEIARQLGLGVGEVKLVIDLFKD